MSEHHSLPKQPDIVDTLRDWSLALGTGAEFFAGELGKQLDNAAAEIVRLRSTLCELSACVQGAEKRKECVKHARRLAPLPGPDAFMLHQFHKTDLAWREIADNARGTA